MNLEPWTETRPWGRFKNLLDCELTKVKVIEVNPGCRLSYQSHNQRRESWTMVQGLAEVTLNEQIYHLKPGDHIDIPVKSKHRIQNSGTEPLIFIEVQTGTYFGEDDIIRYQDDFGRQ